VEAAVVVQLIEVWWTKLSRGGEAATRRNAIPDAFPLTRIDGTYVANRYSVDEENDFRPRILEEYSLPSPPRLHEELILRQTGEGAFSIGVLHTHRTGAPYRRRQDPVFKLGPGEIGRVVVNGRHSGYHGWRYRKATYNVAVGSGMGLDVFLGREPDHVFSWERDLF
jgi:hypothetical protein